MDVLPCSHALAKKIIMDYCASTGSGFQGFGLEASEGLATRLGS